MFRRAFLHAAAVAIAGTPAAVWSQATSIPRVGFLYYGSRQ